MVCLCQLFLAHMGTAAPYTSDCKVQMLPTSAAFWHCSPAGKEEKMRGRNGPRKSV